MNQPNQPRSRRRRRPSRRNPNRPDRAPPNSPSPEGENPPLEGAPLIAGFIPVQVLTEPTGPLTLEQRCVRQFPRVVLGRGRQYFNQNRAEVPVWNEKECSVTIKGTGGDYKVTFDFTQATESRRLGVVCDCPAYARGILCKHIWTAILQIDKSSPPGTIPETAALRLIHSQPRPRQENASPQRGGPVPHQGGNHSGNVNINPNGNHGGNHSGNHSPGQGISLRTGDAHRNRMPVISPSRFSREPWMDRLNHLQGVANTSPEQRISTSASAYFVIAASETNSTGKLIIDLWTRHRAPQGELGPLRPNRVSGHDFSHFSDPRDQEVLSFLIRTGEPQVFAPLGRASSNISSRFTVDPIFESHLVTTLAGNGKLYLSRSPNGTPDSAERSLKMDRTKTWDLMLRIESLTNGQYRLDGLLKNGPDTLPLSAPVAILKSGFMLFDDRVTRFTQPDHAPWAIALRNSQFLVPKADGDALLTRILLDPASPRVSWPSEMGWSQSTIEPRPKGVFRPLGNDPTTGRMTLNVSFLYEGREVALSETETMLVDPAQKKVFARNVEFEEKTLLNALEILQDPQGTGTVLQSDLHRAANDLCRAGWVIHIENQKLRVANDFEMNVSSSTDWFDLKMGASFDGTEVSSADLLAALESGGGMVKLADGTLGIIPPEWLAQYAPVAQLGIRFGETTDDGSLRFTRSQGLMLNSVLTDNGHLKADADFLTFRERIQKFEGVKTAETPAGFKGTLRDYQKEGLNWLGFLEDFGTGGILADDMGLGKTIQVLAFLLARSKKNKMPCLVVAPKSLTFNWIDEAKKFAPELKVVRYSGPGRSEQLADIPGADLVVTTYGAIRTDIKKLQEIEFDVAIIDEAQAIKNSKSQSAAAVKKIRARHHLALTGTPVENSIKDLLSILEFTNPGLLGLSPPKEIAGDTHSILAKTLKPFMLRRTKEKVLTELPEKSEQVLYCEMSPTERKYYNAIREKYRLSIEQKIEEGGLGKSKLHVLEALLRLRQAASHSGLVDPRRKDEPSAKLQLLLSHLEEVTQEGHKALVFSQFTSLLALVRKDLDAKGIKYEYLDGQTADRKTPVEHFQTDPECKVFLISLKAGGTGLNLTAADYVFILDPWWNPAVEAQAIGRAHRMGQKQTVFAYRMIAKDTVEEKILELQKSKRDLADSLISEDQDFMSKISKEDLQHLLS
ncbi:MAG: DEAD/DEAH box helicase [Cryobacterium sp.]|nr:DEAD/DEAH box helicase [Oligoflexia bacterium]